MPSSEQQHAVALRISRRAHALSAATIRPLGCITHFARDERRAGAGGRSGVRRSPIRASPAVRRVHTGTQQLGHASIRSYARRRAAFAHLRIIASKRPANLGRAGSHAGSRRGPGAGLFCRLPMGWPGKGAASHAPGVAKKTCAGGIQSRAPGTLLAAARQPPGPAYPGRRLFARPTIGRRQRRAGIGGTVASRLGAEGAGGRKRASRSTSAASLAVRPG